MLMLTPIDACPGVRLHFTIIISLLYDASVRVTASSVQLLLSGMPFVGTTAQPIRRGGGSGSLV
jgi:hypothetical protein